MLLALLGSNWLLHLEFFGQIPAHFVLDDFFEGNVGQPKAGVLNQRPAASTRSGVELADPPGNQVDQDVRIEDLCQCLFTQFAIQECPSVKVDRAGQDIRWMGRTQIQI